MLLFGLHRDDEIIAAPEYAGRGPAKVFEASYGSDLEAYARAW